MNANYILPGGTRVNLNKGIFVVNNSNRYILDNYIISKNAKYAVAIIREQDGNAINEYLALLLVTQNGEIINTDTKDIERYIDSFTFHNDIIEINLLTVGPNDSNAKPTLKKKLEYRIVRDKLVKR